MKKQKTNLSSKDIAEAAKFEGVELAKLARLIESGRALIASNPIHSPKPVAIGEGLAVKINVNIGTSPDHGDINEELCKARVAIKYGADAIMDLSSGGDIDSTRRAVIKNVKIPVGTVPIYQAGVKKSQSGGEDAIVEMTEDDMFGGIEQHAKDGVDFMTVHCGITRETVERIKRQKRVIDIVSRGGSFLASWILHNDKENPLYENYDYLLELAQKYGFALSLGDGLRPGSVVDATDRPQLQELIILGELVDRAREAGVPTMVEGPGHVPLNQIEANVRVQKTVCKGAPFYVLGPLVTDIAPGYDHITGAIGGALAAYYGADFLCYVTPSEHLALPTIDDVKEGTIASKIAAHAADIARGRGMERDALMSKYRFELDWEGQFKCSLDPEKARAYRERTQGAKRGEKTCTMCGNNCAMKISKKYLRGK